MLPCGHTFCLQCILAQVAISSTKQSNVSCSLCRQIYTLPEGDAGKLPKNYSLAAVTSEAEQDTSSSTLAAAVDAKFLCKTHIDQKIVVYCKDCKGARSDIALKAHMHRSR
jgi:ribosomal protein S27E